MASTAIGTHRVDKRRSNTLFHLQASQSIKQGPMLYTLATLAAVVGGSVFGLKMYSDSQSPVQQPARPPPRERVVLLGGSTGIGKCIALLYASSRPGTRLIISSPAFDEKNLLETKKECQELSKKNNTAVEIDHFLCDFTDEGQLEDLIKYCSEKWDGMVDTLLINAGTISVLSFEELLDADKETAGHSGKAIDRIMKINTIGPILATKWFLPLLKKSAAEGRKGGRIVVTSSAAGHTAAPKRALYSASKHAVQGFFNGLRPEIAQYGVSVTLVCPLSVDTQLRSKAVDAAGTNKDTGQGQQRKTMSPEFVAEAVCNFIVS